MTIYQTRDDYKLWLKSRGITSLSSFTGVFSALEELGVADRIELYSGTTDQEKRDELEKRIFKNAENNIILNLKNKKSYIKKYIEFLCENYAVIYIGDKPITYRSTILYPQRPYRVPKWVEDDRGDRTAVQLRNVFYSDNVKESERIPGLLAFLDSEIEFIFSTFVTIYNHNHRFLDDVFGTSTYECALHGIPVIIRKETPVERFEEAECCDLFSEINKRRKKKPDDFKKEILDLIDRMNDRCFDMPIHGLYHSDGGQNLPEIRISNDERFRLYSRPYDDRKTPYIEIFFRNFNTNDPEKYAARLAMTLAHEMFHFFHNEFCGDLFETQNDYRKSVIEATADFFSVFHMVHEPFQARLQSAQERYKAWKKHFGTFWPYAYALCFFRTTGAAHPFTVIKQDYFDEGFIEKLSEVVELSKTDFEAAFGRMVQDW